MKQLKMPFTALTTIPLTIFLQSAEQKLEVGRQLHVACRDVGFFYVTNHGKTFRPQSFDMKIPKRWAGGLSEKFK